METLEKFNSIPIVDMSLKKTLTIYNRVKKTNFLVQWGLETSENVALSVIESFRPAVKLVEGPLEKIDKLGLGILEKIEGEFLVHLKILIPLHLVIHAEKMPNLYLPPEMIYWNTKEYVSDRVVKPVLKRADSFGDVVDIAIDKVLFFISFC